MRYDEGAQEGTLVDVTEMYINNSVRRRARVIGETPRQADPEGPSNYPRGLFTMPSWRLLCGGCDRDTASSLRDTEPPSRIDEQSASRASRRSGITLIPAVAAMITKRHADRLVELIVAYAPPIAIWSLSLDRIRYRIKRSQSRTIGGTCGSSLVYPPLSSASSASSLSRSSALGSLIYMLLESLLRPATRSDSRLLKLAGYRSGRFVSLDSTIAIDASRLDQVPKCHRPRRGWGWGERGEMPQSSTRRISRCISGFSTR